MFCLRFRSEQLAIPLFRDVFFFAASLDLPRAGFFVAARLGATFFLVANSLPSFPRSGGWRCLAGVPRRSGVLCFELSYALGQAFERDALLADDLVQTFDRGDCDADFVEEI